MSSSSPLNASMPGLEKVKNLIAISSCKGGVGKSSTAVNLAFALAAAGKKVGLFDADVYGPSLPTMVSPEDTDLYQQNNLLLPLVFRGVKLMSFGYIPKQGESQAAILRGPMVTQIIQQLLGTTDWGELDYLLIDFPPGTGDVQLTLAQISNLTAALIVTTPQQLSLIDVEKGIEMFDKLSVPTIGLIENMSYYEVEGERHYIFGKGAGEKLAGSYGFSHLFQIPIHPELSQSGDSGTPFILQHPEHPVADEFLRIAQKTIEEIDLLEKTSRPELVYNLGAGMELTLPDGSVHTFHPHDLRLACRCASCVNEMTGERTESREDLDEFLHPTNIRHVGNYAVGIEWSDGRSSCMFPYKRLIERFATS